ncbi:MAG: hypothetical protein IPP74_07450 [Alphaproteobacteria bacterium]|nr:hypothetical protein [Alphaproteobacteria bacterium]
MFFSIHEIHERLRLFIKQQPVEYITVLNASGRVLAEDVFSPHILPPVHLSAVDGYAVRAEDILKFPVSLKIHEPTKHDEEKCKVKPGYAVRVYTGSPLPQDADVVLHINNVFEDHGYIHLFDTIIDNLNITFAGSDMYEGYCALKRGTIIKPQHISLLSLLQLPWIPVYKKPRIGIMVGDAKILGELHSPFKLSTSLAITLFSFIQECGGIPVMLGDITHIIHSKQALTEVVADLNHLVNQVDCVVMAGSLFSLKYDMSQANPFWDILIQQGADLEAYFIRLGEQESVIAGTYNQVSVLALPATLSFAVIKMFLILKPAISMMMGIDQIFATVKATLTDDINEHDWHKEFIHAHFSKEGDQSWSVTPQNFSTMPLISALTRSNGLIAIDKEGKNMKKGNVVDVLSLCETV